MTDGETSEPDGGSSSSKPSKAWLVALPVVALIAAGGLWAVTRNEPAKSMPPRPAAPGPAAPGGAAAAPVDPSLEGIAVQRADLPEPSVKCSFSGDMETYLKALKDAKSGSYDSVAQTWKQLQEKGAIAAYSAWWGDAQPACDSVVSPSNSMDHGGGSTHPTTTFSFVVRYNSPDSAASAYSANIFGQSSLKGMPNYEVTTGSETGLGENSTVGLTPKGTITLHQAIWQNETVTVYYGSENLPLDKSKQVTESVNRRIT